MMCVHWLLNFRSDLESALVAIFDHIFKGDNSESKSGSSKDNVGIFLDAAVFTKHNEGTEECMSFQEFRRWSTILPSVRKFLGSLLLPPDPGILICFMGLFFWFAVCFCSIVYIFDL